MCNWSLNSGDAQYAVVLCRISLVIGDIQTILGNNTDRQELTRLIEDFENFQRLYAIIANGSSVGESSG